MHPRVVNRLKHLDLFAEKEHEKFRGPFKDELFAKAVNNTKVDISCYYEVKITMGNISFWYPVRVCNNMDLDLILGSDLSDYTIMETSTEKRWVQLKRWDRNHPVTIPFSKDSVVTPLNLNLLHVVDPVELEPHSQQQVQVRVSRTVDYDEAFCSLAQPANPRSSVMMEIMLYSPANGSMWC